MRTNNELGMRIRYIRKSLNMSQEDLALEANVNKNYLCDLENGRRNPSLEILIKVARALNLTLEELFKGINI